MPNINETKGQRDARLERARVAMELAAEDYVTLQEAVDLLGLAEKSGHRTLRKAIRAGRLKAFLPGGTTNPIRAGAGLGYRIMVPDLADWWFGRQPVRLNPDIEARETDR